MKAHLASKIIFFLALAFCVSNSFLSCSKGNEISEEEKVLETWNTFFKIVIQNKNLTDENLSVSKVQSVQDIYATPPRPSKNSNLKARIFSLNQSFMIFFGE